jgi:hypothetical protein
VLAGACAALLLQALLHCSSSRQAQILCARLFCVKRILVVCVCPWYAFLYVHVDNVIASCRAATP